MPSKLNQYLISFVLLIIILFSGVFGRKNASLFKPYFDNLIFKTVFIFIIGYSAMYNIQLSFVLAIAFIKIIHLLNNLEIDEAFQQTEQIKSIEHFTNTIENIKQIL